jgi:ssDNA-binding Zn-finger/Zn-ribbon topoisomerase 1
MTAPTPCPRCGSPMVPRTQGATGEPFLGCSRYPSCRGTRPLTSLPGQGAPQRTATQSRRPRRRLSDGRRYARNVPDVAELLVARLIGRDLGKWEGCLVQVVALILFLGLFLWFLSSGLFLAIVQAFSTWFVHQIHLGPAATPIPSPS